MTNTRIIIKSKPRVIPKNLAKVILAFGNMANKLTIIQNNDHKKTVKNEFFPLKYLEINHMIATKAITGNINAYKYTFSPFRIDV